MKGSNRPVSTLALWEWGADTIVAGQPVVTIKVNFKVKGSGRGRRLHDLLNALHMGTSACVGTDECVRPYT